IGLLLNTSGLELALGVELDPNRALRSTGLANLLTGAIGGMSGHVAVSGTLLADRMGVTGRTAGLARAAALLAFLAVAGTLVSAMPVFVTGGLVTYLGGELFYAWAIVSRRKLPLGEWAIIPLMLLVIVTTGFLAGIGVGLLVAVLMFAYTYSRLPVVRFSASGRDLRSTVDRSAAATTHLDELGRTVEVMHLQGFLFFGTAERVVDQVRLRLGASDHPALRHLILDFRHVSGVDSAATACFLKLRKLTDAKGVDVAYTEVAPALAEQFRRAGLVFDPTGPLSLQPDVNAALERCEAALLADLATDEATHPLREQLVAQLGESPWIDPLIAAIERVVVPAGALVIRTGDTARDVFLLERGTLAVQVAGPGGTPLRLRTMTAGAIVGEVARYTRQPRGADVIALEETVVHRLSADALARLERETQESAVLLHRLVATNLSGKLPVANRLIQRARL
ncbi:MAG: cyclic nucleotide-binding domain-containing protein, partial [Gemmatimonadota bacterium]